MNTITLQLNDSQYDTLMELLDHAQANLKSDRDYASDDETEVEAEELLADHEELVKELVSSKSYTWTSGLGEVDLDIPAKHVDAIAQSGDNEPACLEAIENDPYLKAQLMRMNTVGAVNYLKDAGIENGGDMSDDEVRVYILWTACHDINDERAMGE